MAKRADRKKLATVAGIRRVDIPAETAQRRSRGGLTRGRHLFRCEPGQGKAAWSACEPVEQVLGVDGNFTGGAEEPGVAGDSPHTA